MTQQVTTDRAVLDQQADAIEQVLHQHKAPAHVTGGNITPRFIQFVLQPAQTTSYARVEGLSREIAIALGTPSAIVRPHGGAIRIEVPRSDPQPISLANMLQRLPAGQIPAYTALFGLADDGAPLLARVTSPDVKHIVISGPQATGKTALLLTIALSLAALNTRRSLQLIPIGTDLAQLQRLPHLNRDLIGAGLPGLVSLMTRRTSKNEPRVMVVIDEITALMERDRAALPALLEHGHETGVHVIGATRQTLPSGNDRALLVAANAEPITVGDFVAYTQAAALTFEAAHATPDEIGALITTIGGGR